jgi:hypothetical protein
MKKALAWLATVSLVISPATAGLSEAAFSSSAERASMQTSMFAGATYRIGFDRHRNVPRGRASLRLGGMAKSPTTSQFQFNDGLEIRGGETGKPALYLAGRDIGRLQRKSELSGSGTALVIGGIVVLAVVVALVAADAHHDNKCSEEEDC